MSHKHKHTHIHRHKTHEIITNYKLKNQLMGTKNASLCIISTPIIWSCFFLSQCDPTVFISSSTVLHLNNTLTHIAAVQCNITLQATNAANSKLDFNVLGRRSKHLQINNVQQPCFHWRCFHRIQCPDCTVLKAKTAMTLWLRQLTLFKRPVFNLWSYQMSHGWRFGLEVAHWLWLTSYS